MFHMLCSAILLEHVPFLIHFPPAFPGVIFVLRSGLSCADPKSGENLEIESFFFLASRPIVISVPAIGCLRYRRSFSYISVSRRPPTSKSDSSFSSPLDLYTRDFSARYVPNHHSGKKPGYVNGGSRSPMPF